MSLSFRRAVSPTWSTGPASQQHILDTPSIQVCGQMFPCLQVPSLPGKLLYFLQRPGPGLLLPRSPLFPQGKASLCLSPGHLRPHCRQVCAGLLPAMGSSVWSSPRSLTCLHLIHACSTCTSVYVEGSC